MNREICDNMPSGHYRVVMLPSGRPILFASESELDLDLVFDALRNEALLSDRSAPKKGDDNRIRWCDAKSVKAIFGISRSTLYRLADAGKVKTSSLRERENIRGKRLFSYDSIAAFIERNATGGEGDKGSVGDITGPELEEAKKQAAQFLKK